MTPDPFAWELIPKQQFGQILRKLRKEAGMLSMNIAEQIGISPDLASRLELGQRWPRPEIVRAWATATGHEAQAEELIGTLAELRDREARLRGEAKQPNIAQDFRSDLLRKASRVRTFAIADIPFYLQSAEYAQQELGDVAGAAEVVATRRNDNNTVGTGKYFEIILAESALRSFPCDPTAMRKQLADLQGLIGMPGVEFGVIPLGRRIKAVMRSSFTIFDDVTVVESYAGAIDLTPKIAQRYIDLMDLLWDDAVRLEEARALLTAAASDLPAS